MSKRLKIYPIIELPESKPLERQSAFFKKNKPLDQARLNPFYSEPAPQNTFVNKIKQCFGKRG